MILKNCCICLKEAESLKALNSASDDLNLKKKLEYVAPEHDWLDIFSICPQCNVQLDNAYDFKQLCVINDSFRKEFKSVRNTFSKTNDTAFPEDRVKKEALSNNEETVLELVKIEPFGDEIITTKQHNKNENVNIFEDLVCPHCARYFKSKSILDLHVCMKHGHVCKICEKSFSTKKEFRVHRKAEHPGGNTSKFQCETCGEHFSLLKNILEHGITVHSMNRKDIKPYCCNECNNKFASSTLLIQHKKYHNGDRTFVCSICGKAFVTRRDLNGHEKLHENHRNYGCDKCDKSFNTSQNLKTHIYVVHTDSSQWKYSCPICAKRFAMKTNCNEHIKRHQGNKDFICHICKKTFVSNHEVKKHVRLHSNIAPFNCTHCQKHYRDRRSLDIHLSKAHGIGTVKPSARVKKFVCHICPSQFFDNQKLQRHIRTHTGVKPFSCHECNKRFIDKSYLTHHLKSVHNINESVKTEVLF